MEGFEFLEAAYRKHAAAMIICDFLRWAVAKRNRKATIIQRGCHNWIYKDRTSDGKVGIWCRVLQKRYPRDCR